MSCVWMISDCHFGHVGLERFRPSVTDVMDNDITIYDNILSSCGKRDTLWFGGDCFLREGSLDLLRDFKKRIGFIHIVLGNHDTERDRYKTIILPAIKEGLFDSVHGLVKMKSSGKAWLSHAPMHPQELWGKINIHGHVHLNTISDDRYVNICVDNTGMKPVKLQDIYGGWRGYNKSQ